MKLRLLFFLMLVVATSALAQNLEIDATFNTADNGSGLGDGADQQVNPIAVQSSGKILISGYLDYYNGTAIPRFVRLNSDGTLDGTFNMGTGVSGQVNDIGFQSDGKVIIVGQFASYNGTAVGNIARLNADGSLDNT